MCVCVIFLSLIRPPFCPVALMEKKRRNKRPSTPTSSFQPPSRKQTHINSISTTFSTVPLYEESHHSRTLPRQLLNMYTYPHQHTSNQATTSLIRLSRARDVPCTSCTHNKVTVLAASAVTQMFNNIYRWFSIRLSCIRPHLSSIERLSHHNTSSHVNGSRL